MIYFIIYLIGCLITFYLALYDMSKYDYYSNEFRGFSKFWDIVSTNFNTGSLLFLTSMSWIGLIILFRIIYLGKKFKDS